TGDCVELVDGKRDDTRATGRWSTKQCDFRWTPGGFTCCLTSARNTPPGHAAARLGRLPQLRETSVPARGHVARVKLCPRGPALARPMKTIKRKNPIVTLVIWMALSTGTDVSRSWG